MSNGVYKMKLSAAQLIDFRIRSLLYFLAGVGLGEEGRPHSLSPQAELLLCRQHLGPRSPGGEWAQSVLQMSHLLHFAALRFSQILSIILCLLFFLYRYYSLNAYLKYKEMVMMMMMIEIVI